MPYNNVCKWDGEVIQMPKSSACEGSEYGGTKKLPARERVGGYCDGENKGGLPPDVLETVDGARSQRKLIVSCATGTHSSIITAHPLLMRNIYRGTPCCKRASAPAGSASKLAWRARAWRTASTNSRCANSAMVRHIWAISCAVSLDIARKSARVRQRTCHRRCWQRQVHSPGSCVRRSEDICNLGGQGRVPDRSAIENGERARPRNYTSVCWTRAILRARSPREK